jgi:hypothetical protein
MHGQSGMKNGSKKETRLSWTVHEPENENGKLPSFSGTAKLLHPTKIVSITLSDLSPERKRVHDTIQTPLPHF